MKNSVKPWVGIFALALSILCVVYSLAHHKDSPSAVPTTPVVTTPTLSSDEIAGIVREIFRTEGVEIAYQAGQKTQAGFEECGEIRNLIGPALEKCLDDYVHGRPLPPAPPPTKP